jgi:hypothetical protein
MQFSVARTEEPNWETAPYIILKGDDVFLEGIQERSEAEAIVELLSQSSKVVAINTRQRWLAGGRRRRHLAIAP